MIKKAKLFRPIILFFLFLPVITLAGDSLHTAKKTVTKSFPVSTASQLFINNQYGDITVSTWQKNEVSVKILIKGQAKKLQDANALVKLVKIESQIHSDQIKLNTIIDTTSLSQLSDDKQCHISYEIFAPDWLTLDLKNIFGNIQLGNYTGKVNVDEKFGDFKAGILTGFTKISIDQGSFDAGQLNNCDLAIKGFKNVHIASLSGTANTKFSYGNQVDIKLGSALNKLNIDADNVKPLLIRNLKEANADLKIHALLSKCIYNGIIQFSIEDKEPIIKDASPAGRDTLTKDADNLLLLNKIKELPFVKKINDFEFKTGKAKTDIKVNVAFSVLDVRD